MKSCIYLFIGFALVAVAACSKSGNVESKKQPIAYNHSKHVEDNGMECLECHQYAEEHSRASIPNIDICGACHDEAITDSDQEKILIEYIEADKKVPWQQVNTVPDYAYFSHRRHVAIAGLDCAICHGEVGKRETPFTKPYVKITMQWCLDCHEEKGAATDCYACHR